MGVERFLAEIYKGFFRTEDQQKYLDFKIEEQASYDPKLEAQLQSQTIVLQL